MDIDQDLLNEPYSSAANIYANLYRDEPHYLGKYYAPHVVASRLELLEQAVLLLAKRLDDIDGRRTLQQATTIGTKLMNTDKLYPVREWPVKEL